MAKYYLEKKKMRAIGMIVLMTAGGSGMDGLWLIHLQEKVPR